MSAISTFRREIGPHRHQSVTSLDTAAQLYEPRPLKAPGRREQRQKKRQSDKRKTKVLLAQLLCAAGHPDKAADILRCRSKFGVRTCGRHVIQKIPTFRCRFPLCPDCAVERRCRTEKRLLPRLHQALAQLKHDRLVFITLTAPNSFEPLPTHHSRFREWFRRLRRNARWQHRIRGGIVSFEVTVSNGTGWHYHAHLLAFRKAYYDQAELSDDWSSATGGRAFVVDIRETTAEEGLREVLKYIYKPADLEHWTVEQVREFMSMKGARFSSVFGNLYGMKVDDDAEEDAESGSEGCAEGDACPQCGDPLFSVILTAEELEALEAGVWLRNKDGTELCH